VTFKDGSDKAVELFAGYIPYYRACVQDGICDDAMLKFSVPQAPGKRSVVPGVGKP
jgi:hypothetical protein